MKKHQYSILIDAPAEKVWDVLFTTESYKQWTKPFSESSGVITDWKEGSKVHFTGGEGNGMVALIEKRDDNKFMSFKHIGELKDGVEDLESSKNDDWNGALENYTLEQKDGKTNLVIDIDVAEEWAEWMDKAWPHALEAVKSLSEQK